MSFYIQKGVIDRIETMRQAPKTQKWHDIAFHLQTSQMMTVMMYLVVLNVIFSTCLKKLKNI